jgi:hypothetical protein
MINWLNVFQSEVNRVTKYEALQFTISAWGAEKEDDLIREKGTVEPTSYYLPLSWTWNSSGMTKMSRCHSMCTGYIQEGQALKHLNSDITYPPRAFREISTSVLARLARLATNDENNKIKSTKELSSGEPLLYLVP